MTPYPWLTIGEDGSIGADLQGCTGMEMDRRLVIMQEIEAGRVVVADPETWRLIAEALETASGVCQLVEQGRKPIDLQDCWIEIRAAQLLLDQLTPPAPSRSPRSPRSASPPPR